MENYCLLFTDILFANLFITSNCEMANYVMIAFGYDKFSVVAITIFSSLTASLLNYFCGMVLFNLYKHSTDQKLQDTYNSWQRFSKNSGGEYCVLINIIGGIGNIIGVVAGFLKMNIFKFATLILLSRTLYYSYVFLC